MQWNSRGWHPTTRHSSGACNHWCVTDSHTPRDRQRWPEGSDEEACWRTTWSALADTAVCIFHTCINITIHRRVTLNIAHMQKIVCAPLSNHNLNPNNWNCHPNCWNTWDDENSIPIVRISKNSWEWCWEETQTFCDRFPKHNWTFVLKLNST